MQLSRYEAPANVEEAVRLLAADADARVIAGGTDLLVQVRGGRSAPSAYVDIKRIPELLRVQIDSSGLRVGAAVPAVEIYGNDTIRQLWPGLAEATDLIGSTQIQGRATWSGNLCNSSPAADSAATFGAWISAGVEFEDAGERTLKGVGEPVRLWRAADA